MRVEVCVALGVGAGLGGVGLLGVGAGEEEGGFVAHFLGGWVDGLVDWCGLMD